MNYLSAIKTFHQFRIIVYFPLLIPAILIYFYIRNKNNLQQDITQWKKLKDEDYSGKLLLLIALLVKYKDFRNLYYYRTRMAMKDQQVSTFRRIVIGLLLFFSQVFLRKLNTLLIGGNIGGGLVLYHCYYGIISPENMGENCRIWHGVTIGFNNNKAPTIGNNVTISAGATVIGGIKIGDNTIIGPNALVVRNIGPNCVVISEPSYIVKRDGKMVLEKIDNTL